MPGVVCGPEPRWAPPGRTTFQFSGLTRTAGQQRAGGHGLNGSGCPRGPDATIVTEIYHCSQAPEEERAGMDNGKVWVESMAKIPDRLDALRARQGKRQRSR